MIIKHKNKQRLGRFFVVPGNGQALLGMLDIKLPDILNVKCSTVDTQVQSRNINKQHLEKKSKGNRDSNTNPRITNKDKYKIE